MSYTSLNYHIVFSTKGRKPVLSDDTVTTICRYIGGILRNNKASLLASNGMPEHLHLAVSLHPETCLSDMLRKIKSGSSKSQGLNGRTVTLHFLFRTPAWTK